MAYRTYINGQEWLGNNVLYDEIYNELQRQGCKFDNEECWREEPFEVKDLDGLVRASERAIINLYNKRIRIKENIADFTDNIINPIGDFTWQLKQAREYGYIFISAMLLEYVGKFGKQWDFEITKNGKMKYRLINDGKCLFTAY